jgi:hypothetical protein
MKQERKLYVVEPQEKKTGRKIPLNMQGIHYKTKYTGIQERVLR